MSDIPRARARLTRLMRKKMARTLAMCVHTPPSLPSSSHSGMLSANVMLLFELKTHTHTHKEMREKSVILFSPRILSHHLAASLAFFLVS